MSNCYICGQALTENNASDEHIIMNALGGHIHSRQLLCKTCNTQLGLKADAELARELEFCASYLDIPRQRGENRRIETEREDIRHLIPYIKGEQELDVCWYFYPAEPVVEEVFWEISGRHSDVAGDAE